MATTIEKYCDELTRKIPQPTKPKKVMCVRERNVDFGIGKVGILKPVMAKRFIKNNYTNIQLRGSIHNVSVSVGIYRPIVWIEPLS